MLPQKLPKRLRIGKAPTPKERKYLAHIRAMPCVVCQAFPVEVHHVIGYADKMGRAPKRHDRVVPLCPPHHNVQAGPKWSVHAMGHPAFCRANDIDLMAVALQLWEESGG